MAIRIDAFGIQIAFDIEFSLIHLQRQSVKPDSEIVRSNHEGLFEREDSRWDDDKVVDLRFGFCDKE